MKITDTELYLDGDQEELILSAFTCLKGAVSIIEEDESSFADDSIAHVTVQAAVMLAYSAFRNLKAVFEDINSNSDLLELLDHCDDSMEEEDND